MKTLTIEVPLPSGADLIERDAYARGVKEGMQLRVGALALNFFLGLAFGLLLGMGVVGAACLR